MQTHLTQQQRTMSSLLQQQLSSVVVVLICLLVSKQRQVNKLWNRSTTDLFRAFSSQSQILPVGPAEFGRINIDSTKYVGLVAECFRTGVQFPPSPPHNSLIFNNFRRFLDRLVYFSCIFDNTNIHQLDYIHHYLFVVSICHNA